MASGSSAAGHGDPCRITRDTRSTASDFTAGGNGGPRRIAESSTTETQAAAAKKELIRAARARVRARVAKMEEDGTLPF